MNSKRTIYTKYHEKMERLLKTCKSGSFSLVGDDIFEEFSTYFLKTVKKEAAFNLYRYTGLKRVDSDSNERIFSFDTDSLYLSKNGNQNDIFEGIAQTDYSFTTIEECITALSNVALLKCFTEDPKNNLMWAHYANSYKGICVEYDIKRASKEAKKMLFPVVYRKRPEHFIDVDEIISGKKFGDGKHLDDCKGPFAEKPFCWKYEKEWRICHMNKEEYSGKNIVFPYISKVFLGPRIEPEDKKKVLAAVKAYNEKGKEQIVVYTTKLRENTYDIEFKEYDWEARE